MPPLLAILPIIAASVGIAGTGVGLGLELSNQPGSPKPAAPPTLADTTPGANANKAAQEASISQQFPNIQAQTGGSLSPESWIQLSQLVTGNAGSPGVSGTWQDLLNQIQTGNIAGNGGSGVTAGYNANTNPPAPGSPGLTNSSFG